MLVVKDKSAHEEHLSQPRPTNNIQFKIAFTFLTDCNGIFNVTDTNNEVIFAKSISDEESFILILTAEGAHELESLNNEIKRINIEEEHYTEAIHPFTIKPNFSTTGSDNEIPTQGPVVSFVADDSIRDFLGFIATKINEEYNLSPNPFDILSFDIIFLERDIAQGTIYRRKRSVIFHNFTMDVDPGNKYNEKFRAGVQWHMMESKHIISSIWFKLKNEKVNLVSFNGQSVIFSLSIKEI